MKSLFTILILSSLTSFGQKNKIYHIPKYAYYGFHVDARMKAYKQNDSVFYLTGWEKLDKIEFGWVEGNHGQYHLVIDKTTLYLGTTKNTFEPDYTNGLMIDSWATTNIFNGAKSTWYLFKYSNDDKFDALCRHEEHDGVDSLYYIRVNKLEPGGYYTFKKQ